MREVLSGNREVAAYYLPVVKAEAVNFATRCKNRNLSQDSMTFSFDETGTSVSIQYRFGEVSIFINAPAVTKNIPTRKKTPAEIETLVWIKKFDNPILGSYNGLFFDSNSFIYPRYEEIDLVISSVTKVMPNAGAELSMPTSAFDSWSVHAIRFGLSSSLYIADCKYYNGTGYAVIEADIISGILNGYRPSCFFATGDGNLNFKFGGDIEHPEINDEISGSISLANIDADYPLVVYGTNEPVLTLGIGIDLSQLCSDIASSVAPLGISTATSYFASDQFIGLQDLAQEIVDRWPEMYPSGIVDSWYSGNIHGSNYFLNVKIEAGNVSANINSYGPDIYNDVHSDVVISGNINFLVSMIKKDGTVISESIPAHNSSGYVGVSDQALSGWPGAPGSNGSGPGYYADNGNGITFILKIKSFYVPSNIFVAKRNFFQVYTPITWSPFTPAGFWFVGGSAQAFAYGDETGWLPCDTLGGIMLYDDEANTFVCGKIDIYDGKYFGAFSILKRSLSTGRYIFTEVFSCKSANRKSIAGYWGYEDVRFILNYDGSILSIHNAVDVTSGIYKLSGSSATLLHAYAENEIEPVYVSDDGSVVVTKKKIYFGERIILCNECCGIFIDHTHFLDKSGPEEFVIKKILPDSEIVVDTLSGYGHNFYELSEDSSVCVISRFHTSLLNPGSVYYAVVVDFADPVYKFEFSDQVINQFIDPEIFINCIYPEQFGYPGFIPYGARYVSICECTKQNVSGIPAQFLKHYVYNTPPGGTTFCKYMDHCPMHNLNISGTVSQRGPDFPTSKSIVPQYQKPAVQRSNVSYDEIRLNKFIYHHAGRILRRISDGLVPIEHIKTETYYDN